MPVLTKKSPNLTGKFWKLFYLSDKVYRCFTAWGRLSAFPVFCSKKGHP